MNDILKTARAAAFVVAACAPPTAGAYAQQADVNPGQPSKPQAAESRPEPARAQAADPLPADPPAVAPRFEAQPRALPSAERAGVEVGEPLTLTLADAVRMALENNNDIEATRVAVLYNPGLRTSWFIVTGTIGLLMVMIGSLVASASMVNEKESGTIEQLLMTPAGSTEIIAAKVAPIMLLLSGDILVAVGVVRAVFDVPVRGSLVLLYFSGMLCVLAGIGIGTFIATFTRSQTQAQLMSFFVNPPISMLSGATTPIEGMPYWLQQVSYVNPLRHFSTIARGVLLKGVGLDALYPNLLALTAFTLVIVGASVWRFRKQLS